MTHENAVPEARPKPDPKTDRIQIPAREIPSYRTGVAIENGVEKNLLFTTWGGLGDQLCAEPTLRFALETIKDCKISLATEIPQVFRHLKFDRVFDLKREQPKYEDFLVLETINDTRRLTWEFMSHMVTHCVDFPSLCSLRCQVPLRYKQIQYPCDEPSDPDTQEELRDIIKQRKSHVLIHAGKHWESKTFPKEWWDQVYDEVVRAGLTPVLIGKDVDFNVGIVDVKHDRSVGIDLRNRCSLNDTLWLCKNSYLMICSDSAPMHMAAPGDGWIAFVATAKHPDYLLHHRRGGWAWRMKDFGKGGMWDLMDYCPNKKETIEVDKCPVETLKQWLPEPKEMVDWLTSNVNS
jgi:hypothetical protein